MRQLDSITAKTMSLLLDKKGKLPDYDLLDCAVRGAILVDLVASGLVGQAEDAIEMSESSTGSALFDRVLNEMLSRPGSTLRDQIRVGSTSIGDVRTFLVETDRWSPIGLRLLGRRFKVVDPELLKLCAMPLDRIKDVEPLVWCLLSSAGAITRPPVRPQQQIIDQGGEFSWAVEVVVDELLTIHRENEQTGWALRLS